MSFKCAIVVPTISEGDFLNNYARQIIKEGRIDSCLMIVISDMKTKPELFQRCFELRRKGINILCPTLEETEVYLKKIGPIFQIVPYNSCNRRNIGFLMALEEGCDYIISMDDDNYCRPQEIFFKEHEVVCQDPMEMDAVYSSNGWFNICDLIETDFSSVYPRGFPYHARFQSPVVNYRKEKSQIHINAGLWLKDPDIDTINWMTYPVKGLRFKGKSFLLGKDTWTPINTQNTALHREAIVSYYYFQNEHLIKGMPIKRHGDIFSGYFVQACCRHLGYRIRVGTPVVDHIRNPHHYLSDLTGELPGIWMMEDILPWLKEVKLEGHTYEEVYLSLSYALEEAVERFKGFIWDQSTRNYFHRMAENMRIWVKSVRVVSGLKV